MRLSWRERLAQQPALWEFNRWPTIVLDTIPAKRRKTFIRNEKILVAALAGHPLKDIAQENNISSGRVTQLLNRCLGGEDETAPALTTGLVPFTVIVSKQRHSQLPSLGNKRGHAYAFQSLLQEVPGLHDGLDEMITAKLKDTPYAQSLTPHGFHGEFKRLLAEVHWPADCYPYTSPSLAYESLRRYLHQRTDELRLVRQNRRTITTVPAQISKRHRSLQITQTDEHTLDMSNHVHLVFNDELVSLRLARASAIVSIDVDTHCILGHHLALSRHPNQQDMLTLLDNCMRPWQPMEITTPGLSYTQGACFPSGLPEPFPITFGTMQLDNALMHRAQSVIDLLCDKQGGALSYGHPATPTVRALVESVFDYIAKNATQRFASTSGSHPTDPKKESRKNQKRIPTVSLRTLEEALSIIFTEYNVTPQAALAGATPLELFRHHYQTHFVRYAPMAMRKQWQPLLSEQTVTLHWHKKESRAPHINFIYARYQGPGLWQALPDNKKIIIRFNRRDIRNVHAYTLQGVDLGILYAPRSWQRFSHSVATRLLIHELNKTHRFNARDPLASYFRFLLENKGQPKAALQLLRVYDEYTQDSTALILDKTDGPTVSPSLSSNKNLPKWHSDTANHRR